MLPNNFVYLCFWWVSNSGPPALQSWIILLLRCVINTHEAYFEALFPLYNSRRYIMGQMRILIFMFAICNINLKPITEGPVLYRSNGFWLMTLKKNINLLSSTLIESYYREITKLLKIFLLITLSLRNDEPSFKARYVSRIEKEISWISFGLMFRWSIRTIKSTNSVMNYYVKFLSYWKGILHFMKSIKWNYSASYIFFNNCNKNLVDPILLNLCYNY